MPDVTAPEEGAPTDLSAFRDATTAYASYTFPAEDQETVAEEAAPSRDGEGPDNDEARAEEAEAEPAAEEAAPPEDQKQEADGDDLPDEEVERILRHPKGQERLNRLLQNKYGNELQRQRAEIERQVREAIRREDEQWREAESYYHRLQTDDAFFDAQVAKHGKPAVSRWIADYETAQEARNARAGGREQFDADSFRAEFATAFNNAAVEQFREIAARSLPFYGDLPDETRKRLESLRYEPDGNWLADGFRALAEGVEKHIAKLERQHAEALAEARKAGRYEAIAEREESQPVVVESEPGEFRTWREVEFAYAEGRMSREEFRRQMSRFGKDF